MKTTFAYKIANTCEAIKNCKKSNNPEWEQKHLDRIHLYNNSLPSGSGMDSVCKIDVSLSGLNKVVILTSFHHLDENGYYVGWTDHTITVTPSFFGINLKISGRNRNDIKDYLYEVFENCLMSEMDM